METGEVAQKTFAPRSGYGLTKYNDTAKEILRLLAEGCTQREIAERVFLSVETVQGYYLTIRKRWNAATLCQAVALAVQAGEITM